MASSGSRLEAAQRMRLFARYGVKAGWMLTAAGPDLDPIPGTCYLWAELRQAARAEGVVHLDDLLLRRLRLGLLLPHGGKERMEHIRRLAQPELGWDDARWQAEVVSYARLWEDSYRFK